MIKVLRVVTRLNVGGPSKQIMTLNQIFLNQKFEQVIVCGEVLSSEIEIDLTQFQRLIKIRSLRRGFNPIWDCVALFKLCSVIRKEKPDVIHSHLSKAWALAVVAKSLSFSNARIIHTFHGHILHSYFSNLQNFVINKIQKILASQSDTLVSVNKITKNDLLLANIGRKSNFVIIRPGFDSFHRISKVQSKKILGLQNKIFTIGYIGRFESIKRPDLLLEIINSAKWDLPEVQFLICGGGSLYENFQNKIQNPNVKCLSWQINLSHIYSALDLMILTSDNEGSPLTIIEAGKLGIPTLSRSVGGVPELINQNITGYLTGNSVSDFISSLHLILENPQKFEVVCYQTKKYFEQNFSILEFKNSYRDLYMKIVCK